MKIDKVTITGADDKITFNDLKTIQDKYPFVEWAILFSRSKCGQQRYPSEEHLKTHFENNELNLAAHFCGWYSAQVLENQNFQLITDLPSCFKRIQINYNFKVAKDWDINHFMAFAEGVEDREFIFQYNKSNAETLDEQEIIGIPSNVHFLHDGSGGRGTEIKEFQEPFNNIYTGYSGGISTDNIKTICETLNNMKNTNNVWIDMESGVRTDNEFDLKKVETILSACSTFIKNKVENE